MSGALDGLRVLDLSRRIAGPYAAILLAEQGAEVIRIDPPGGDPARGTPGYHVWNRSKRLVSADPETATGRATVAALAAGADVVICDATPAEAQRLGWDDATLGREHPALVYCAMPPFGSRGPLAEGPAEDALAAARGGILGSQSSITVRPTFITLPLASYGAALLAAGAVSAALFERARHGTGQRVEVSWLAGALAMQTGSLLLGESVQRLAGSGLNPLGAVPVYRLFEASDGAYLFIACGNPRFFQRLCLLLDHPEWISDPRFEAAPWGVIDPDHRQALAALVAPIIATRPRAEWLRLLTEADIPNAPVMERGQFIDDPQTRHLGMRLELDDPLLGPTVQMGVPVRLHGSPGAIAGPLALPEAAGGDPIMWQSDAAPAATARESRGAAARPAEPVGDPGSPAAAPSGSVSRPPTAGVSPRVRAETSAASDAVSAVSPLSDPGRGAVGDRSGPLAGIRVLDLSSYIAGAYCPMTLADFGADVIKVESLDGDAFRTFGFGFLGWNRGKRGLAVDLRTDAGRAVVHDLVRTADVVVENFRPGVAAKLGVDYDRLHAINPRIVYSTITAFGSDGPLSHLPGFDPLLQARSGAMAAQGGTADGHPPVFLTVAVCDYTAALLSVFGICAALVFRERTGHGQHVESSLVQSAMAGQAGEFIFGPNVPPPPAGGPELNGVHPGLRLYKAADGWLMVAATTAAQIAALARATGIALAESVTAEPADSATGRALATVFGTRIVAEWETALQGAGVPVARVLTAVDLFDDDQVAANDLLAEHQHPIWGKVRQTGVLAKFAATPGRAGRVAPLLGEHTVEVLHEIGYDQARISELLTAGVIGAG